MSSLSRLPSLNALRAFSVVARHLNLRRAADELCVTPSALSHQIRGLEEALHIRLFERTQSGLKLTHEGGILQPGMAESFEKIVDTLALLHPVVEKQTLTISMLSTFAMRWFIPRLTGFQLLHPNQEIRIATSIDLVDFESGDVDCAIRSGSGVWPNVSADYLFSEQLTPVCSPALISREKPMYHPSDLVHHTLLHAALRPEDWQIWLKSAGVGGLSAAHEQTFETRNFAIAAAIKGVGVAIVDPSLVSEEIASGRLIQPFEQMLSSENAYYFVSPKKTASPQNLIAFKNWLLREARK